MSDTTDPSVTAQESIEAVPQRAVDSEDPNVLRQKLELIQQDNRAKGEKNRHLAKTVEDLQKQITELQQNSQKQKQAKLAESGEFQQLWKDATASVADRDKRIAELESQLQEREAAYQQQTIQARAVSAFQQAGVQQSDHMYALLKDKLRMNEEGAVVALDGGVQTSLGDYLNNLKAPDSQFAYMFAGSGARGMGSVGSTPASSTGGANPYATKNFTEIVRLEAENPELAARLKAQAG